MTTNTNTNAALVEYANPLNWDVDENGIRRVWKEPGSETPEAYNGFELAKAALSTAAQPTEEPVAYLWQHSETGRTRVVMLDAVITADATWRVVGPLVLAAAPKAYAAPAPAVQPPAGIWVPTELAERVQETMGEFLMDHGWRQQDMDTSDEFGALLAAATKAAAAPAAVAEPVAWLHDDPQRYDVIHAEVKDLLVKFRDAAGYLHRPLDKSAHYTIPLYTAPAAPASQDAEDALMKALERAYFWMDSQADTQSKGGHATFDLMMLREERDAAKAAIDAARARQEGK